MQKGGGGFVDEAVPQNKNADAPLSIHDFDKLLDLLHIFPDDSMGTIEKAVVKILDPCLRGVHKFHKIFGDEKEQFMGSTIYETGWCTICGFLQSTSWRQIDGKKFDVTVVDQKESQVLEGVRSILNNESRGA